MFSRRRFVITKVRTQPKALLTGSNVELTMAPHAGFETESIKEKARKDLLHLLEGVSKAGPTPTRVI